MHQEKRGEGWRPCGKLCTGRGGGVAKKPNTALQPSDQYCPTVHNTPGHLSALSALNHAMGSCTNGPQHTVVKFRLWSRGNLKQIIAFHNIWSMTPKTQAQTLHSGRYQFCTLTPTCWQVGWSRNTLPFLLKSRGEVAWEIPLLTRGKVLGPSAMA